jgi:carbamoyl-phosphate synthase large subunit
VSKTWTVAITGMNARPDNPGPGYAVARCLKADPEFDGKIIGLGYDVLDAGLYHAHIDSGYLLPYPAAGEDALLERLLEIHEQEPFHAIIPCLDAELPSFIRIQGQLAKHGTCCLLPSDESLRRRNKAQLSQLCQELSVLTPETVVVSDTGYFRRTQDYPLVVKGAFYDAYICHTAEEAEAAYFKLAAQWGYPVLSQRYYRGQEINLTGIGDGQRLLGAVMMRKRALTDKGKAWAGVSVVDEQLERLGARLVEGLGWCGPFELEVLRSEQGELLVIEINPRFPAWIYLSVGVGRNLPAALVGWLKGAALPTFPPLKPGVLFVRYAEELILDIKVFESLMMSGKVVV